MISSNNKWLIHTLLVGLIPVLTRLLTWAATAGEVDVFATADFITLGLVVHISIINEIERLQKLRSESKALLKGLCLVFVTLFGALYALTTIGERHTELINASFVLQSSIAFCIGSTALGLVLFHSLTKRGRR